ncbi:hypothetical protein [Chrysiogenes arsenatis]|uniref:hypothetical protein n=1 Tax=Chrysiogenes arsenatis TaxID=309797 RepID=UPI0003FA2EBD|nr:hypothetical protein [Chrysiogenes arsenatis]
MPIIIRSIALSLALFSASAYGITLDTADSTSLFAISSSRIGINSVQFDSTELFPVYSEIETSELPGPPVKIIYEREVRLMLSLANDTYELAIYRETSENENFTPSTNTFDQNTLQPVSLRIAPSHENACLEVREVSFSPLPLPVIIPGVATGMLPEPFSYQSGIFSTANSSIRTPFLYHYQNGTTHVLVRMSTNRVEKANQTKTSGNFERLFAITTAKFQSLSQNAELPEMGMATSIRKVNTDDMEVYSFFAVKGDGRAIRTDLLWIPYILQAGTGFYIEATAEGTGVTPYGVASNANQFLVSITPESKYFGRR